jgi:hypothetical protein
LIAKNVEKRGSEFYSVYSVFVLFGVDVDFSMVRSGQNASPWSQLFFIFKCVPISQAGRRRFDPGLPLHLFNNLQRIEYLVEPTFRDNEAKEDRNYLIN